MSIRVLLYTSTARNRPGGVQSVYRRLADGLRSRGHVVSELWGEQSDSETGGAVRLGLPERRSTVAGSLRSIAGTGVSSCRLVRELLRSSPDVVNVHFARTELAHFLALRPLFRYRLVVSVHGTDVVGATGRTRRRLGRFLARADALTAVSEELVGMVAAMTGVDADEVVLVPNGIDTDFWSPAPGSDDRVADRPLTCVSVGRLAFDPKGHDILLRAFARVRSAVPESRLVLVGQGPHRDALEQLCRDLGIADVVTFAGSVPPAALRELLRCADVFVMPSRREGLPMALLEAMAAGLPAVVTEVGAMPEVVGDSAGSVVPPEDPDALASAIVDLLCDPRSRSACAARARERAARFAAETVDDTYEALFQRLLAEPGGSNGSRTRRRFHRLPGPRWP